MAKYSKRSKKRTTAKAKKTYQQKRGKRKTKDWIMNITDWLFDSIYDVVTWVCIALSCGFLIGFYFTHRWRGFVWAAAMLLIFSVVMLAIRADRFVRAKAAVPSAEIAISSLSNITERPYITVTGLSLTDFGVAKHPKYLVVWRNSGSAVALKASTWSFLSLFDGPIGDNPEYPKLSTSPSVLDVGVGESRHIDHTVNFALSDADINAIQRGKVWLYVYGWIDYNGPDGRSHKTKFCGQYIPSRGDLVFCPNHNGTD